MAPWTLRAQVQAFLTVKPAHTLVVHWPAFPSKQYVNAPIAVSNANLGNLVNALSKWRLVGPHRSVAVRSPVKSQRRTAAALADAELVLHPVNDLPTPPRR
jgi:hypothetical protein